MTTVINMSIDVVAKAILYADQQLYWTDIDQVERNRYRLIAQAAVDAYETGGSYGRRKRPRS